MHLRSTMVLVASVIISFLGASAGAQQIYGTPGSPDATMSLKGDQLPPPPEKFGGVIKEEAKDSKPYWPPRVVPPKGAPNILLIMTDDSGYGVSSAFGGVIPTPALERIAKAGLRYTQFHSTALCSPTRAAIITGRNHHSVGFGVIGEMATGYPGYDSVIGPESATIGRILSDNGYATSWFGKNHNTPSFQYSAAGPFDQWPSGMGFQYFYGFMGGESDQWTPYLFQDHTPIQPWIGRKDYNLVTDMADEAIKYMKNLDASAPEKPFFVYYVPGATHDPHQPTKEWIDKISAMHLFDDGWEKLREKIFANQKRLGVIPPNTQLTPWPDDLPKWDSLSAVKKKIVIREADVFAAYTAYVDHEIGRVIQAVEDMGKLDNTLIIYIEGDNGTSAEGTLIGTPNEVAMFNQVPVPVEDQLKYFYDVWGSDQTYNHMAVPWAWAFDTPFSWTKQIASHFGGVKQGMAISWPGVIQDKGAIRTQFHHVIDVVPTILEAAKIKAPAMVDGIPQKPIEGVSMVYTFDAKNAKAPSRHHTQYFEMMGDRAIYHDGWIASTKVMRPPWDTNPAPLDPMSYPWELYDLAHDWTQSTDVAAQNPAKVKELQTLFMQEAQKHQVLPLDTTVVQRLLTPKPSLTAGRTVFTWTQPLEGTPNGDAPSVLNTSYHFKAEVEIPQGGSEGMLITQGGRFAGYGFYLLKGKPVFLWNLLDLKRIKWEGSDALPPGKHVLEFDFKYDGLGLATLEFGSPSGIGQGGTGVLRVDGKDVATQKMEHTIPFILQWDENLDIGSDTLTGVNDADYQPPFAFTGKIDKITLSIEPPKLTPQDIERLKAAQAAAAKGTE